ncbi:hypothetical protein GCM10009121_04550 [Rhodanobacter soli]
MLGCEPTDAETKGQTLTGKVSGMKRIARTGTWRLRATDREPEDLEAQIDELLEQLTDDLAVWSEISRRFKMDLFCGLFMKSTNDGLCISSKQLAALGLRGIELELDIYDPTRP